MLIFRMQVHIALEEAVGGILSLIVPGSAEPDCHLLHLFMMCKFLPLFQRARSTGGGLGGIEPWCPESPRIGTGILLDPDVGHTNWGHSLYLRAGQNLGPKTIAQFYSSVFFSSVILSSVSNVCARQL